MSHAREETPLELFEGDDAFLTFTIKQQNVDGSTSRYDLTAATIRCYGKTSSTVADAAATFTYTSTGASPRCAIVGTATNGQFSIRFNGSDLASGNAVRRYKVRVTKAGYTETVAYGNLRTVDV